ncbi:RNA polymerase ECF family sigma subunit [Nitrospirillum amazonense]|uniref:RNA polymerase ECF family sigma subunit n=1 Tax=Nitrospirillum amazonense TaxID=28077 RepID=A0A560ETU4_9PROT|nr:ECF-type sigma factor [Nitrospirillum amazonense]TWB12801.1 RNA polymerase ECF family sigma subunit [Nitrospirillum amazonense]
MTQALQDLVDYSDSAETARTADILLPVFYDELRRLAKRTRGRRGTGDTLQTTALIHETYLKLRETPGFADEAHFLRASALAMRHILVNHARDRLAAKRGGGVEMVSLEDCEVATDDCHLLEVNEALGQLAAVNPRWARLVECRFFAGFSETETAKALGITDRTVRRDWIKARAWLLRELSPSGELVLPTPDKTMADQTAG